MLLTRRDCLAGLMAASLSRFAFAQQSATAVSVATKGPLGFSLYGMKTIETLQAITTCAEIGYAGIELPVQVDWPCDSALLPATKRKEIRQRLQDSRVELFALMEHLVAIGTTPTHHQKTLERLKLAAELAHDLAPEKVPLIETVFGGKPDEWPAIRPKMVEALGDWAKVAAETKTVLAIKGHAMAAVQRPADVIGLVKEINSPWLKVVCDYSHFQRMKLSLEESVKTMVAETVFVHVKDNVTTPDGKTAFVLPGDGDIDYVKYAALLKEGNYRGPVVVEVSGQVFNLKGYDPIAAAKKCYAKLKPIFG